MFNVINLFKHNVCPRGDACELQPRCVYGLHPKLTDKPRGSPPAAPATGPPPKPKSQPIEEVGEPSAKRRKVTYDSLEEKPRSGKDRIEGLLAKEREAPPPAASQDTTRASQPQSQATLPKLKPPPSLRKPISPPPTNGKAASISSASTAAADKVSGLASLDDGKIESLNPRLVDNVSTKHGTRLAFLKALHAEMARLNQQVHDASGLAFKQQLHFNEQRLIKLALNEDEKFARENGTVYGNVIKNRVFALKKMPLDDWVQEIKLKFDIDQPKPPKEPKNTEKPIVTGLPLEQEALILPQLVADQNPLAAHGYVITPPTEEAAQRAAAAVALSKYYEECDRCGAHFQVFPDRNEDGLLCGGGSCTFHPLRKQYPQRAKTDRETGSKQPFYPCCGEEVGKKGCTEIEHHVYKTSSPARLASILPFINTPANGSPAKDSQGRDLQAVTFDCEMGYTVNGMELIRMTAVAWPTGEQLVDVLVRPLGAVIDLNSRFSGVFAEDFANAIPYAEWKEHVPPLPKDNSRPRLPVVANPQKARELLCSFLKPTTPLMGHAIDNDLNTVRLCHPTIVDTVLLFPHPRGLPMRFGLKMLSARHLNRHIQTGGAQGHDSKEDAIATGDLVRVRVRDKWKELRLMGWKIVDGYLLPPPQPTKSEMEETSTSGEQSAQTLLDSRLNGSSKKRKRGQRRSSGGADEDTAEESSDPATPDEDSIGAA